MQLATPGGVLVADVSPDGPAAAAHLKSNDLITAIDGEPVDDLGTLNYRLATLGIGGTATLGIVRDGKQYQTVVSLQPAPETVPRAETTISGNSPVAGATVINLSPAVADEMLYHRHAQRRHRLGRVGQLAGQCRGHPARRRHRRRSTAWRSIRPGSLPASPARTRVSGI